MSSSTVMNLHCFMHETVSYRLHLFVGYTCLQMIFYDIVYINEHFVFRTSKHVMLITCYVSLQVCSLANNKLLLLLVISQTLSPISCHLHWALAMKPHLILLVVRNCYMRNDVLLSANSSLFAPMCSCEYDGVLLEHVLLNILSSWPWFDLYFLNIYKFFRMALKYFNGNPSPFNEWVLSDVDSGPKAKRRRMISSPLYGPVSDEEIALCCLSFVKIKTDYFRSLWNWSSFMTKFLNHEEPYVRW